MSTLSSVVYIVEGAIMMPSNALLVLTILCDSNLRRRKELLLIVALAFIDVFSGLSALLTGSFRIYASNMLAAAGNATIPMMSPWSCFFTLHQMLIVYTSEESILLMTAISIERLIAVAWFQWYSNITTGTIAAWTMTAFIIPLFPLAYASYQVYISSAQGALVSSACGSGGSGIPEWYAVYHNWFCGAVGIASVLIYGAVLAEFRKIRAKVASRSFGIQGKMQNRLTITLAIITLFTLLFHSIPFAIVTVMSYLHLSMNLAPYAWMFVRINSLIYVFVIYWRHAEVRKSIEKQIFGSKATNPIPSFNSAAFTTQN